MQGLDDLPVGGGGEKLQLDEFAQSSTNAQVDISGPIEVRIVSKNWQIRAAAFEEIANQFKLADNQQSQEFRDHAGSWKKYLLDANPASLEKCLDALEVFINRADPKLVASCQNDVIKTLFDKCISHAKPIIKTKSLEIFNMIFEVSEAFDDSIDSICECLNPKNVKMSTSALIALNSLLSNYGVKKIKIKQFLPHIEALASQSNPGQRQEAMNFYKECYRHLGEGLKALIQGLKKQQLDDLEKEFVILKEQPKAQLRLTRTEQEKMKEAAINGIILKEEEEKGSDIYDLVDAVDLTTKYCSAEWQDKLIEAKQWKEKKDLLDELFNDSNVPKIQSGDFSSLAKIIRKLIGDSNIPVSQISVKVCGNLAKGLRKDFEPCCRELLPALLAKFREKKTQVIEDTNAVVQTFLLCTNLEYLLPDLILGLSDKAPSVKKNVCNFIERAAQETYIDVVQRISGEMLQALMKATEDPQSEVRDAALSALGIMKGRLGEAAVTKYIADLNPQKLQKVNESAQNVKPSKYDKPEHKEKAPEPPAAKPLPKKKPSEQEAQVKKQAPKKQEDNFDEQVIGGKANTQNAFDDMPIGGNKPKNEFDEQPIGGGKNPPMMFDEQPIGGNKPKNTFDEQPIGGGKKGNAFDEQPIGGNKGNTFDEQPIGGNKGSAFDDQPIGGNKPKNTFDEQPIGGNKGGAFDEQPIGGNKGGFQANDPYAEGDEIPIKRGAYNLDNLDDLDAFGGGGFGNPPPIKKKVVPKKKVIEEEKKDDGGDVLMSDDTQMPARKVEAKKAPPKKVEPSAKPSTTTVKTAAKGPQIQDEDVGAGLSKEEAEAKVQETFSAEIVALFEEAKWQDKVAAFKGLGEQIIQLQPAQDVIESVVKFTKSKMKDWKESNLNLIKESIALFLLISLNCEKINKRAVACIMPFICDKIGDVKLVTNISETILNLSEIVTPKFMSMQVIKYCSQAKAPNTIKEGCNVLIKMTDEFGVMNVAIKEMIEYGILAANNTNPQVRTQSMVLFALMYQHAGETIKNFLKDIKESTMKLIDEEFAKVTPFKQGEYQQKRNFRGEAAAAIKEAGPKKGGGGGGGIASLLDDALPRIDISKSLGPKLMPMFKHADWKVRKEAADKVEELCRAASMRIQPVGLVEVMDNIRQRMVDPNKAVLKQYIQLIGVLVEALGTSAKQFQKKILPAMLATLADKQSLVRGDAIACMDKWAEHVGAEVIINNVGPMLTTENPELRTEALKWIIKQKDSIKNSEVKEYTKALTSCLSDRTPAIRNLAEEVISYVMPFTGFQAFQNATSDLLPAVASSIKPILERIKQKVGVINVPQDQMMGSSGAPVKQAAQTQPAQQQPTQQQQQPPPQPTLKQGSAKPQVKPKATGITQNNENQNKPPQQSLNQSLQPGTNTLNQSILKKKENQTPAQQKQLQQPQRSESRDMIKPKGLSQTITQFKQPEEVIQETVNVNFGFKEKRAEYDRKTKFQLEDIKGDQMERLKQQTSQALGASFSAKMYSNDFKLHVECIEAFNFLMNQQGEALVEILDIIFKWGLVKLQDSSNTKFAVSIFDFFSGLFQHLEESELQLWDFEANIIFALLCEKSGINNNILKDKVKKLIKMIYPIYDLKRGYQLIVQYGLNSKNLRAQAECLDELSEYLIKYGVDYCSEKELKLVAKMADNADKNVREYALRFMGEVYKVLDDNIWRAIGDVTPKVQGLLEQRFKKLKVSTAPQNGGLTQQSSQSNFYGVRDQSPKQNKDLKTSSNVGLRKTIQQTTEMNKQSATPRSGLQFQKGFQPQLQKPELSKSINQFNQSNKSNDEQKRTPYQNPKTPNNKFVNIKTKQQYIRTHNQKFQHS